jgi:hypothetical protein
VKPELSEIVIYDLLEHDYRGDFGPESLLPCRNRRERQQMTVFMSAIQQVFEEEEVAAFRSGANLKRQKQAKRALRFAALEKVGRLIVRGLASTGDGTKS